jgi:rSAM/selenodomain-associated transferase 1
MRRALIVVGKAPVAGRTKTRLVPPLTPVEAAALYGAFLLDSVDLGLGLCWECVSVVHPRGEGAALRELLPREVSLLEQRSVGLGDALTHAFEHHLAQGFDRVVLIGSDNPTLPAAPIEGACAALTTARDIAIGPTPDGGYYLIGMAAPHLGVFDDIAWSTPRVYAQTLARAAALGLRVHPVPKWDDVDEPADLDRLHLELRSCSPDIAPHTRAALERLAAAPNRVALYAVGTSSVGVRPDRSA